jgi:hypothetical protein
MAKTVDLLLGENDNRVEGFATAREFTFGEDVRRRRDICVEMMVGDASAP